MHAAPFIGSVAGLGERLDVKGSSGTPVTRVHRRSGAGPVGQRTHLPQVPGPNVQARLTAKEATITAPVATACASR